jgi:DNA-binding MarR family transcriptional regulator
MDAETRLEAPTVAHKRELRLWLRLLACTRLIETEIRRRLREEFDVTLPRFDLMAQLEKAPGGMTLGEVSRRMMVSNGNVTGLVERLASQGLVERAADPSDRRATLIRLTAEGRRAFARMARAHEGWIAEIFAGLAVGETDELMDLLGRTKASAAAASG